MTSVREWLVRRRFTFGLATFLSAWYVFQLVVLYVFGESTAVLWFYWELPPVFPPNEYPPGVLFALISHKMHTVTHIVPNLFGLVVAGSFAEPRIGGKKLIGLVIGLGYVGLFLANSTAFIHQSWMVAGTSGGVISLWAYAGLEAKEKARKAYSNSTTLDSRVEFFEGVLAAVMLVSIPLIPPLETVLVGFNSGHTFGFVLGVAAFVFEGWLD